MTLQTPSLKKPVHKKRLNARVCRILAVFGLCAAVMPVTGFWVGKNDANRGIAAVRMRIDYSATLSLPNGAALSPPPVHATENLLPLALDRARYRATLRDAVKPALDDSTAVNGNAVSRNLLSFYNNQVTLALADEAYLPLRRISTAQPSQTYRFWMQNGTFLPADGVHRTADPTNTRWLTDARWKIGRECTANAETSLTADMQRLAFRMQLPFAARAPHPKSAQYMEMIEHSAKRFALSPQLIYAVMRTESAFNPFAVSNAGALGLMQVVPDSAGNEVQTYLTGKAGKPSSTFLFDPKSNIEYGSAYLHLLSTRYFAGVRNQTSRELCMIAGYNAGPGAVLRIFSSNSEGAIAGINMLTAEELFAMLSRRMPAEETRLYIGRVLANINTFPS